MDRLKKLSVALAVPAIAIIGLTLVGCKDEAETPAEAQADAYEERTDQLEEQGNRVEEAVDEATD